jgi:hypothetical protein
MEEHSGLVVDWPQIGTAPPVSIKSMPVGEPLRYGCELRLADNGEQGTLQLFESRMGGGMSGEAGGRRGGGRVDAEMAVCCI